MTEWMRYEPFNRGDFSTLWELADQLTEQYRREHPFDVFDTRAKTATEGVQYLARWIFTDEGNTGPVDFKAPHWDLFVKQFFRTYLNREISYKEPGVWRMNVIMTLLNNRRILDETLLPLYSEILESDAVVTGTSRTEDSGTETGNSTRKNDETTENSGTSKTDTSREGESKDNRTETSEGTHSSTASGETSTDGTEKRTETGTSKTSGTTTTESKTSSDSTRKTEISGEENGRQLSSDMPHSIVNAETVGNPELTSWKYASGLTDTFTKRSSSDTATENGSTTGTTDATSETSGEDSRTADGSSHNTENRSDTQSGEEQRTASVNGTASHSETDTSSRTDSSTGTRTGNETQTSSSERKGTSETTSTNQTISDFQMSLEKYQFFVENAADPVASFVALFQPLFISVYPEESRYGYLTFRESESVTDKMNERGVTE